MTNPILKAFKYHKPWCKKCHTPKDLTVHHKDGNKRNNKPSNLEILCRSCHDEEDNMKPRKKHKINKKYQPGTPKWKRK